MTQSGFPAWSQTASSNSNADSTVNWAEGQAPSSVNDSARAMMAALAKYRDDVSGSLTTGGTATAYTLSTNQGFVSLADMDGVTLTIVPNATSGATPTLAVDGLTAKGIKSATGVAVATGALVEGTPYRVTYFNTAGEFILHDVPGTLGAVVATTVTASGAITGPSIAATGAATAATVTATGAVSGDSIAATNAVTGATVTTTGLVTAGNGLTVSAGTVSLPAGSIADAALATPTKISKEYVSSVTSYAFNQAVTFAHGLGVIPKIVQASLHCSTANIGYSVGDEINLDGLVYTSTGGAIIQLAKVVKDATNVTLVVENSPVSSVRMLNKGTAGVTNATDGDWSFIVRAWA